MTTTVVRRAGVLVLVAATATALTACTGVIGAKMTYSDVEKGKITAIVLNGGNGDVKITAAAGTQTTINRIVQNSTNPGSSYHLDGTTLTLDSSCGHDCGVSYDIQTVPGVTIQGRLKSGDLALTGLGATDIQLTSGDVTVRDAAGPVKIDATSGDIQVLRPSGPVAVHATSGDVRALDARGPVSAEATSGDIQIRLAAVNSVTAEATSGDVDIIVPQGSYNLRTRTRSGDESVQGLTSDPASKNVIDTRSSNGDVSVSAG
jgi:hypothetical protein